MTDTLLFSSLSSTQRGSSLQYLTDDVIDQFRIRFLPCRWWSVVVGHDALTMPRPEVKELLCTWRKRHE